MANKSILRSGPRAKIYLSLAVVIITSMAVYNWAISPQTAYLDAAQHYERVARKTEQKTEILKRGLKRIQSELADVQYLFTNAGKPFFDKRSASEFFSNIESMASNAGCKVDSLSYMAPKEIEFKAVGSDELTTLSRKMQISLTGQYKSITEFIGKLSDNEKKVFLSDLNLETAPDFMTLTCSMYVTIYMIEDKETANNVNG